VSQRHDGADIAPQVAETPDVEEMP